MQPSLQNYLSTSRWCLRRTDTANTSPVGTTGWGGFSWPYNLWLESVCSLVQRPICCRPEQTNRAFPQTFYFLPQRYWRGVIVFLLSHTLTRGPQGQFKKTSNFFMEKIPAVTVASKHAVMCMAFTKQMPSLTPLFLTNSSIVLVMLTNPRRFGISNQRCSVKDFMSHILATKIWQSKRESSVYCPGQAFHVTLTG